MKLSTNILQQFVHSVTCRLPEDKQGQQSLLICERSWQAWKHSRVIIYIPGAGSVAMKLYPDGRQFANLQTRSGSSFKINRDGNYTTNTII